MVIINSDTKINVICSQNFVPPNKTPILFLHGFTGQGKDWSFLLTELNNKYFPVFIDLPGHGKTDVPNNLDFFSTKSHIELIEKVLNHFNINKTIIVGYSMGGRTALNFAINNPDKVSALILESSTAGIEKEIQRNLRIKTDSEIAKRILSSGIDSFIQYWIDLPFFRSLKSLDNNEYSKMVKQKKKNSEVGLANSLLGFSTGIMPSLWNKLKDIRFPTLLIAGNLDNKYVRINKQMNQEIKNSELKIIKNCGHNTHLENPKEFIILITEFLNNLDKHETQLDKS